MYLSILSEKDPDHALTYPKEAIDGRSDMCKQSRAPLSPGVGGGDSWGGGPTKYTSN